MMIWSKKGGLTLPFSLWTARVGAIWLTAVMPLLFLSLPCLSQGGLANDLSSSIFLLLPWLLWRHPTDLADKSHRQLHWPSIAQGLSRHCCSLFKEWMKNYTSTQIMDKPRPTTLNSGIPKPQWAMINTAAPPGDPSKAKAVLILTPPFSLKSKRCQSSSCFSSCLAWAVIMTAETVQGTPLPLHVLPWP